MNNSNFLQCLSTSHCQQPHEKSETQLAQSHRPRPHPLEGEGYTGASPPPPTAFSAVAIWRPPAVPHRTTRARTSPSSPWPDPRAVSQFSAPGRSPGAVPPCLPPLLPRAPSAEPWGCRNHPDSSGLRPKSDPTPSRFRSWLRVRPSGLGAHLCTVCVELWRRPVTASCNRWHPARLRARTHPDVLIRNLGAHRPPALAAGTKNRRKASVRDKHRSVLGPSPQSAWRLHCHLRRVSALRDSVDSQRSHPPVRVIKGCLEVREPALFLTRTLPRLLPIRGLLFTAHLDLSRI